MELSVPLSGTLGLGSAESRFLILNVIHVCQSVLLSLLPAQKTLEPKELFILSRVCLFKLIWLDFFVFVFVFTKYILFYLFIYFKTCSLQCYRVDGGIKGGVIGESSEP